MRVGLLAAAPTISAFQWVRIQTALNPNFWVSVAQPDAAQVIVRSRMPRG
jgi:hypothetical protein